uniref:Uncharacterized protein n=1 Tax=Anguilla anguilla TaxID=7936 RepID=A0A0E9PD70_ANGAN
MLLTCLCAWVKCLRTQSAYLIHSRKELLIYFD